jgi:competence ComEA-like helix-hairpin-helix protein
VEAFEKTLIVRDSINHQKWNSKYKNEFSKSYTPKTSVSLFKFDPNTLDSIGFIKLGLKKYIASNIIKYRKHGGKFRHPNDFSKIFGISTDQYQQLVPYINISEIHSATTDSVKYTKKKPSQEIIVDINTADTTELIRINGIGIAFAKKIVGYRKLLGGFVKVDQLKEIYGMTLERYEKIAPFCRIGNFNVIKILVNKSSISRLSAHPYLRFYKAKALYEKKMIMGKIKNILDLHDIPEFTQDDIEKVTPYLSFE